MSERKNTKNEIPSNALADLNDNAIILDEFTNSTSEFTEDRFGNKFKTRYKIIYDLQVATDEIKKGSFLPLTGGTVTGNLNVTGNLQKSGSNVLTTSGGTVTGETNFTGGLKSGGVQVSKLGDFGIGSKNGVSSNAITDDISNQSSGFSYCSPASTTDSLKAAGSYGFCAITLPYRSTDAGSKYVSRLLLTPDKYGANNKKTAAYLQQYSIDGWGELIEIITTTNIANYQNGIGVNQKYQDVTSSRAFDVTYTNTTGKTIFIAVSVKFSGSGSVVTLTTTIDGMQFINYGGGLYDYNTVKGASVQIPIPSGSTYKIASQAGAIIQSWLELR